MGTSWRRAARAVALPLAIGGPDSAIEPRLRLGPRFAGRRPYNMSAPMLAAICAADARTDARSRCAYRAVVSTLR